MGGHLTWKICGHNFIISSFSVMIIYWLFIIGIFTQNAIGDELDIDDDLLAEEEEEVYMKNR